MNFYFEPRRDNDGDRHDDDDSALGLITLPAAVLQRHGALVLDPGDAAEIPGRPAPRATVYRARTLLIPGDLLQDAAFVEHSNAVLARVGMRLIPPEADHDGERGDGRGGILRSLLGRGRDRARRDGPGAGILRRLPRPAVLVPAVPQDGMPALPVVVDAWVALQALRAAVPAPEHPALDEQVVSRIALEHLLISSAITGSPAKGHGGGIPGGSDDSGVTGPTATDSYLFNGGDSRTPVAVSLDAPRRKSADTCKSEYGRRPVVAVLDTGVRAHPWLDVTANPSGGGYVTAPDGFIAVDHRMQHVIYEQGKHAVASGDRPRQLIRYPWDAPITEDPLVGELNTDTGHGTFIAGIVRQVARDAQVLAVRLMHGDGVVDESDLICALGLVAARVAAAEAGDPAAMIDVVSLSLGYFDESAADVAYSSGLWQAIEVLLEMGVAVVAAAGNFSTSCRFYPAAFAEQPQPGPVPLISVGALNPNGSKALFSDAGHWVKAWAPGAAVVSILPDDVNGSRGPEITTRGRESLDPDDYSGGWAIWSGTSFSAPLLAAHIARSFMEGAAVPALRLDVPGAQAATNRAVAALQNLGWQG